MGKYVLESNMGDSGMYDEYKELDKKLEEQRIVLRFSDMVFKQVDRALKNGNVSSSPLRELSLRFFILVTTYGCSMYKQIPARPMIPFNYNNRLYSLSYSDGMTMLNCHSCDVEPFEINKVEKAWNSVFEGIREYQGTEFYRRFREGAASIVNHFSEDIFQLGEMEETIENKLNPEVDGLKLKNDEQLIRELMSPRKINQGINFKIKTYVLSVFSFLEYLANCIIPFWNEKKLPEWDSFIAACNYKNKKVKSWMDLYNPKKTEVEEKRSQNRYEQIPEDISVIDVFFSSLPESEKKLVDEYWKLKKSYRHVLTHGELGKLNLHGLSPISRDLDTCTGNVYYEGFFVEDMDSHAYYRVKRFSDDILGMIKRLYPSAMLFLESGQDIPSCPAEFVSLCWDDPKKAEVYLKEMELRDIYDYLEWCAKTFNPNEGNELDRLIDDCMDLLEGFSPIFEKGDDLPTIFLKLVSVENKLLIQFDRYVVLDEETGLAHYGKREELEARGIPWDSYVEISQSGSVVSLS